MKYKVLKSCVINNAPTSAGSVIEVPPSEQKDLLAMGRIMPYDEPKLENRAVDVENASESTIKRSYKKKKIDG